MLRCMMEPRNFVCANILAASAQSASPEVQSAQRGQGRGAGQDASAFWSAEAEEEVVIPAAVI
jgi:hypothetical protein